MKVDRVREGELQSDGSEEHLNADDKVLPAGGHCTSAQIGRAFERLDHARLFQDGEQHALPEGQEDHRLHCEELENGIERLEHALGRKVEEKQAVEGHRDGEVVDERDVEVAVVGPEVTVVVLAERLKDHCQNGREWFDDAELKCCLKQSTTR